MGSIRTQATAALLALLLAGTISAATILTVNGTGGAIPDNNTFTSSIIISDSNTILSTGQNVTLDLNHLTHTWAGDLSITLEHVGYGGPVSVVNRVGRWNNGNANDGDSSNYGGSYSFNNNYTGDLWDAAADRSDGSTIPGGNYYPTSARSSRETAFSDVWNGQPVTGTWILTIKDCAWEDRGWLGSWAIRFGTADVPLPPDPVETPEPATTAMLASGMAGLMLLGRRAARGKG
jgi:subtilisin-like proprotein convertase family protein